MFFNKNIFRFSLAIVLPFNLMAQKDAPIVLNNPSFEDAAHIGVIGGSGPSGWYDCPSKAGESAPDVQPGQWKVSRPPSNGATYLGLVVRDRESWEGVGQRLRRDDFGS